jgi:hypothetical protein
VSRLLDFVCSRGSPGWPSRSVFSFGFPAWYSPLVCSIGFFVGSPQSGSLLVSWLIFPVDLSRWSFPLVLSLLTRLVLPVSSFGQLSRLVSSFCFLGRSFSRFLVFLVRFRFWPSPLLRSVGPLGLLSPFCFSLRFCGWSSR